MTKMQVKVASAVATGALLFQAFATTAFAAQTLEISGNGSESTNVASLSSSNNTTVTQSNNANISNDIHSNSNTGGNEANKNTGGNVTVDTGNAKSIVDVKNAANLNSADVSNCNCDTSTNVLISGNGESSTNNAFVDNNNSTNVSQNNDANITNHVDSKAKTGDNEANKNTGGNVKVLTGDATSGVSVSTSANANFANVGGNGSSGGSVVSARIIGNGADSNNYITLGVNHDITLDQSNSAYILNDVDANAKTGDNEANKNTGGNVTIDTGNALAGVSVDNAANFNAASIDCDCMLDIAAKIAGNGEDSNSTIVATELSNDLTVSQDNCGDDNYPWLFEWKLFEKECGVDNHVNANAKTGDNESNKGTGNVWGDPSVSTGNATDQVQVENAGNANQFGQAMDLPMPGGQSLNLNFSLDLNTLIGLLGLH